MPVFELQGPDGEIYEIDAPDQSTALAEFRTFIGTQAPQVPGQPRQEVPPEALAAAQNVAVTPQQFQGLQGTELRAPQPSFPAERVPENLLQQVSQTARDIGKTTLQGATLGFGDELIAGALTPVEMARGALTGQPVDPAEAYNRLLAQERQGVVQARARSPVAAEAGEIGGALGTAGILGRGRLSAMQGARPTLGSQTGRAALEGAGYGGVYGFGTGEGGVANRIESGLTAGAFGAAFGAGVGASARGLSKVWDRLIGRRPSVIPTAASIDDLATNAYTRAEQAGVVYTPQFRKRFLANAQQELLRAGYTPELQPRVATLLNVLAREGDQNVTLTGVQQWRRIIGNIAGSSDRAEARLGVIIKNSLDDAIGSPPKGSVLLGREKEGAAAFKDANSLYHRARKAETFERLIARAETTAARAENRRPFDAILRSELTTFLKNPRNTRGFTDAEVDALRAVAKGPVTAATIEKIGKLVSPVSLQGLPVKAGLGGAAGTAFGMGAVDSPWWLLLGAIGLGSIGMQVGGRIAGRVTSTGRQRVAQQLIGTGRQADPLSAGRRALIQSLVSGGTPALANITR